MYDAITRIQYYMFVLARAWLSSHERTKATQDAVMIIITIHGTDGPEYGLLIHLNVGIHLLLIIICVYDEVKSPARGG